MQHPRRVAIALSGGVDSAVSAALLKQEGYTVIGLFGKTWTSQPGDGTTCTWVDDRRDALRVAAALAIPLETVDVEGLYRSAIIQPLMTGYAAGVTPNPDTLCNRIIKFGALFERAQALGADLFATGHYAQIDDSANSKPATRNQKLLRGVDQAKDQSYFLWDIPADRLPYLRFPIGHLTKKQVRQLAHSFKLPVADKQDSQGICFLGRTDMPTFLSQHLADQPGVIRDVMSGAVVGRHRGVHLSTVGQRHGFGVVEGVPSTTAAVPQYVIHRDAPRRELWIGPADALPTNTLIVSALNWFKKFSSVVRAEVTMQIRYRSQPVPVSLAFLDSTTLRVTCHEPVIAVSPGQSAVFYQGNQLLGGGIIQFVPFRRVSSPRVTINSRVRSNEGARV